MAYDATKPLDNGYLADAPAELRELFRALKEDRIVNAGQLNGYTQGNASGNIPLNNGTLNTNLNADMLDGHDSAYFSAATHGHDDATTNASGFMSATDKTKLNGIATGAEVNQNAFSNVTVGNSTIQADSKTDTLTLAAGDNVILTEDTANDKVTFGTYRRLLTVQKYTKENVFANPPLASSPSYGLTYVFCEDNSAITSAPNKKGAYHVLTFEGSFNRSLQIAGQCYTGLGHNLYFRARHVDNSDYSQWQQWYRLAKSNATGSVGGASQPVYLNDSGTVTALSATVGSTDTPVYLKAGTVTSTGKSFSSYVPLGGGTMTGALNLANATWNAVGDDVKIGDFDVAGTLGIKGVNGNPAIALVSTNSDSDYAKLTYNGTNLESSKNVQASSFIGNLSGLASQATRQMSSNVPTNQNLLNQEAGTVLNVEGNNWLNTPYSGYQAGVCLTWGRSSPRECWLYGQWTQQRNLYFGSKDNDTILWKQIAFTNSDISGTAANATKWANHSIGTLPDTSFGSEGTGEGGQINLVRGDSGGAISLDCHRGNFRVFGTGADSSGTHVCLFDMDNGTISFRSTSNAPIPTSANIGKINGGSGAAYTLPSGGTYMYLMFSVHDYSIENPYCGVAAGGTTIGTVQSGRRYIGLYWRIA